MAHSIPLVEGNTVADVHNWFKALKEQNLLWHQDDSAHDVFDSETAKILAPQQDKAYRICLVNRVDIHEIALQYVGD